ncbi:MAG TPA: hypothetical protein VFW07_06465 [Parafilimonas sp.]|nr:hypothetical protein [Parafilimonas sp.]
MQLRGVLIFSFMALCAITLKAQVNNTGNLNIAGSVFISSSFTNTSTASYQNNGDLYLDGDFINSQAAMVEGTGTTRFRGSVLQHIGGTQPSFFHNVYVDNAAGAQMDTNLSIGGAISPVTGSLYFNNHALTMGGMMNSAYTNIAAFNVTPLSDLVINGPAGSGNNLYFDILGNTLHNLTVSGGATGKLGNALNITPGSKFGTVVVDGDFNAAGFLTLKSDAAGTARVGKSSGIIRDTAIVERYIPPRRAWRFLSVPFSGSNQTIRDAWQEGVNNTDPNLDYANNKNPHPGFGTHITGNNNTALGYDYNTTINPSIKVWSPSINGWDPAEPVTISDRIADFNAYCIFVRGSRAVDLARATSALADPTVLRIKGVLNQTGPEAPKDYNGVPGNIVLVGNPYASTINISNIINSSGGIVKDKFWVWDPKMSGNYGAGAYVSYTDGVMAPESTPSFPDADSALMVQSGQAFMVELDGSSSTASMNFTEDDKDSAQSNVFGIQAGGISFPVVYTNLMIPSDSNLTLIDGVGAGFNDGFSENIDAKDAAKQWNFNENIALARKNNFLAIELRPMPVATDTLFFKLYLKQQQPYTLQIFSRKASGVMQAWLVDKYLNVQKEINLSDVSLYNFTPNSDTNSYRSRFMLVFKPPAKDSSIFRPPTERPADFQAITIFPNPATIGEKVVLVFGNMEKGSYEAIIYSLGGQQLMDQKIEYTGGRGIFTLNLPSSMTSGIYDLRLVNKDAVIKTIKLVIVSK